jgi:hypothetical protein
VQDDAAFGDDMLNRVLLLDTVDVVDHRLISEPRAGGSRRTMAAGSLITVQEFSREGLI